MKKIKDLGLRTVTKDRDGNEVKRRIYEIEDTITKVSTVQHTVESLSRYKENLQAQIARIQIEIDEINTALEEMKVD